MLLRFGILALFWLLPFPTLAGAANETSLYDSNGDAKAYIAEDLTIYLWDGDPIAYLYASSGVTHIYNFDGDHLGWFENGILRDHSGNATGFIKGAVTMLTSLESLKGLKSLKPLKGLKSLSPVKPVFGTKWSGIPLVVFLKTGAVSNSRSALDSPSVRAAESPKLANVIESYIQGEFTGWTGSTVFKLDNGQIWQQSSYAYTYRYAYHPKVSIIKSGAGYKMLVEGMNETIDVKLQSGSTTTSGETKTTSTYAIQASSNDEIFVINGEIFKAKTYCFNMEKGDKVIFLSGSPAGVCTSADILNIRTEKTCRTWCGN